jgi:hypothetical protein
MMSRNHTKCVLLVLALLVSCSKPATNPNGGVTLGPSSGANSGANAGPSAPASGGVTLGPPANIAASPQVSAANPCALFTAADAQTLMGAPMKLSAERRAGDVCMYEEVTAKPNSMGPGVVSLTLNQMQPNQRGLMVVTVSNSQQAPSRHVVEVPGVGDKAWFKGQIEEGKIGVGSLIVRKGNWAFTLDSSVMEYRVSLDTMKAVTRKIASQLP